MFGTVQQTNVNSYYNIRGINKNTSLIHEVIHIP